MINIFQFFISTILSILLLIVIAFADDHGNIIKERKSLFKQNYSHAKRMSAEITKGNKENVIELSQKMSTNYDKLLELFPDNSKTGYDTEALPSIWLQKEEFNNLMTETSNKVKEFTLLASELTSNELKDAQKKLIWSSCKSCHDKFRMPH
tara:strand:- start:327 stop:779 length:453 start_codon:yes stop_codon:yes gene_type:complete